MAQRNKNNTEYSPYKQAHGKITFVCDPSELLFTTFYQNSGEGSTKIICIVSLNRSIYSYTLAKKSIFFNVVNMDTLQRQIPNKHFRNGNCCATNDEIFCCLSFGPDLRTRYLSQKIIIKCIARNMCRRTHA